MSSIIIVALGLLVLFYIWRIWLPELRIAETRFQLKELKKRILQTKTVRAEEEELHKILLASVDYFETFARPGMFTSYWLMVFWARRKYPGIRFDGISIRVAQLSRGASSKVLQNKKDYERILTRHFRSESLLFNVLEVWGLVRQAFGWSAKRWFSEVRLPYSDGFIADVQPA